MEKLTRNQVIELSKTTDYISEYDLSSLNLSSSNFIGGSFRKADFENSDLTFSSFVGADFTEANLKGVNLTNSKISTANFEKANLIGANLQMTEAVLIRMANALKSGSYDKGEFPVELRGIEVAGVIGLTD